MAKDNGEVAIRKRQQIQKANQAIFITVAIAAFIVGAASVLAVFLFSDMTFKAKVIGAQDESLGILKQNLVNTQILEEKMKNLQTNSALLSSRASEEDNALRVILDALPSSHNAAALGASLSDRLLSIPGVTVESINVSNDTSASSGQDAAAAVDLGVGESDGIASVSTASTIEVSFSVTSDNPSNILAVIQNLERSIRTIKIKTFRIERSEQNMSLSVTADAFYLPRAQIVLNDKEIKSVNNSSAAAGVDTTSTDGEATTSGGAQ